MIQLPTTDIGTMSSVGGRVEPRRRGIGGELFRSRCGSRRGERRGSSFGSRRCSLRRRGRRGSRAHALMREQRQELDGLAQAHVIRETRAKPESLQE